MYFYNDVVKYPIVGFNANDYTFGISTPQPNSFRIVLIANGVEHIISDLYAGGKDKQNEALGYCVKYMYTMLSQCAKYVEIAALITDLERVKGLEVYISPQHETERSKHLKKLTKNKKIKEESKA